MKAVFVLCMLLSLLTDDAKAQAGLLDSTFGVNGIVSHPNSGIASCAIQADGKIVSGSAVIIDNIAYQAVTRFNADGTRDTSFGTEGFTTVQVGNGFQLRGEIILQPDGKVVIGGYCTYGGEWCFALARLNSEGSFDDGFGDGGKAITSFDIAGVGQTIALQPDGKIIQAGQGISLADTGFAAARFHPNGMLDTGFGFAGKVVVPINGCANPWANGIAVQPDGKVILAGTCSSASTPPRCMITVRLEENGELDNGFGESGIVTTCFGAGGSTGADYELTECSDVLLQPDGKIVMGGNSTLGLGNDGNAAVARLEPNGDLDLSYGDGGKMSVPIVESESAAGRTMLLQPDGKVVLGGWLGMFSAQKIFLMRLTPDGLLDESFGADGRTVLGLGMSSNYCTDLALLPDGEILAVGSYAYETGPGSDGAGFLAHFITNLNVGVIEFSKSGNNLIVFPNPISSEVTLEYTLTNNQNVTITLCDLQGKLVQTFVSNENRTAGKHKETLQLNESLPAGNYLLDISNGSGHQGVKIVKQ